MSWCKSDRRRFLASISGFCLALPYLPSIMRGTAFAQAAGKRRFIFIQKPNGQRAGNWYPQSINMNPGTSGELVGPLASISGNISKSLGANFNGLKDRLLLLRGLGFDPSQGGHVPAVILAANRAKHEVGDAVTTPNPSIDQIIAYAANFYETTPARRSVHVMVPPNPGPPHRYLCFNGWGAQATTVPDETSALTIFNQLFANVTSGSGSTGMITGNRVAALDLKVVDKVHTDYKSLLSSNHLSAQDKERLQAHMDFMNDLESKLKAEAKGEPVSGQCSRPTTPRQSSSSENLSNYRTNLRHHFGNIAAAIKCDLTRVATISLGMHRDWKDAGMFGAGSGQHHDLTHVGTSTQVLEGINRWYFDEIGLFLQQLDVPEGDSGGTYLGNSLVFISSEIGVVADNASGEGSSVHGTGDMVALLAGSAGGFLKTGLHVDYRNSSTNAYNQLLITIMQAMGVSQSDWTKNGAGFGQYPGNFKAPSKNAALPGIVV